MKNQLIALMFVCCLGLLNGQNLKPEMLFPDTMRSLNDTVYFTSPEWDDVMKFSFINNDSIDWGTYGYKGVYFEVWTDQDTLTIPHVNHPYEQIIRIPVASAKDTTTILLSFQSTSNGDFSNAYITKNQNKSTVEIPEVYELANIILYLSDCSKNTFNHPNTAYAKRVLEHFAPVKNHPLIKILNKKCLNNAFATYYGFRENSICFSIEDDHLEYNTEYKDVFSDDAFMDGGNFRNMLYLVHDFMDQSNFRSFFKTNQAYYDQLVKRQRELLPLKKMWTWLEGKFPQKMDSYKIVFSPLIGGSHSTQRFTRGYFTHPDFQECVMFINSTESIDSNSQYSEKIKEGLMSGIVFTEIDHNYVNPTSGENYPLVKELMSDKDFWATKQAQQNYPNEYAIFNEYMTHSVFCFYVTENYDSKTAEEIVKKRVQLMERRGYPKFKDFNTILLEFMKGNSKTIYDSYADLIQEMKQIR